YYFVAARDSLNRLSPLSTGDAGSRAVDNTPPAAMASNFDYTQSAEPVQISFSENVWPIAVNALSVMNVDTGNPVTPNNFTYNSTVDTADFSALAANFGKTLPPPAVAATQTSAAAPLAAATPSLFSPTRIASADGLSTILTPPPPELI